MHSHVFLSASHDRHERRTWLVVVLTALMMVGEIAAGWAYGSMALLADGWHMATHAGALGIAGWAYRLARQRANDRTFSFGTGKVGDLAGFSSAIVLAVVALAVAWESVQRLLQPVHVAFDEAIAVATLGLVVNLVSAAVLGHGHDHEHSHAHEHDHNLRAAYLHVLADALTSILAIVALLAGRLRGWTWMDPAMGLVGAVVILRWSKGLLLDTARVLLDVDPDPRRTAELRACIETDGDRVVDLHLWRVGPQHLAVIVSVATARGTTVQQVRARLPDRADLAHVTVEVREIPS
ncbi:MAG: CDF family Co(II)/Ni(II) efflux transporter DmeF [Myxococcota bacterium]